MPLAEKGDPKAQYCLGVMYSEGKGMPPDYARAFRWQLKAATQGLAAAQFNLALMFERGECTTRDLAARRRWYQKALKQGYVRALFKSWVVAATTVGQRFGLGDLLIAAIAAEQEIAVWSLDADFARMQKLDFVKVPSRI